MRLVTKSFSRWKGKGLNPPSVKESYFATCERDKGGRCLPKGQFGQSKPEDDNVAHSSSDPFDTLELTADEINELNQYQPTAEDAAGVAALESEYPGIEIIPEDEEVDYPGIEINEDPSKQQNPVADKLNQIAQATGMSLEDIRTAAMYAANPSKPDIVNKRRAVLQTIIDQGLEVPDAVLQIDQEENKDDIIDFVKHNTKGNKDKALKEFINTPFYDLQVLGGIEVQDKPLPGQAVCYMDSRVIAMGSTSVTGDYRHELGHAVHSFFGMSGKANGIIDQHYKGVMEKVKANPTTEKMSHDWYEENYGVIGSRGLDNAKEDFAEHYRGYHKAIYQDKFEGGDGKNLARYRKLHPEMAKLFDAHYTVALFAQDASQFKTPTKPQAQAQAAPVAQPQPKPAATPQPAPVAPQQAPVPQPQPVQEYNKPTQVAQKMASQLPQNQWVDTSKWAAHNGSAQWAANKIKKYEDLAKAGKWSELQAAEFVTTSNNPNSYQKHVMAAFQKAKMMQAAKDPGPLDTKQWKKVGEQLGSNPGGQYQAPDGKKYYVKFSKSPDHAANEVLASKLYNLAGSLTPMTSMANTEQGLGIASEWMDDSKQAPLHYESIKAQAAEDFGVHAWLANWDSVGLSYDNQAIVNGKLATVDVGGSLLYRAQGSPKAFGSTVSEWDTLRDPEINPQAASVFGGMTSDQLAAAANKVAQISDEAIHKMVDQYGPESKKEELKKTLIARKNEIAKFASNYQKMSNITPEAKGMVQDKPDVKPSFQSPVVKPSPLTQKQTADVKQEVKGIPPNLPLKPIITSAANAEWQKKFDKLWDAAQSGDPAKVEAIASNPDAVQTYSKKFHAYKQSLLNAMKAGAKAAPNQPAKPVETPKPQQQTETPKPQPTGQPSSPLIKNKVDASKIPWPPSDSHNSKVTGEQFDKLTEMAIAGDVDGLANYNAMADYNLGKYSHQQLTNFKYELLGALKKQGIEPTKKDTPAAPKVDTSAFPEKTKWATGPMNKAGDQLWDVAMTGDVDALDQKMEDLKNGEMKYDLSFEALDKMVNTWKDYLAEQGFKSSKDQPKESTADKKPIDKPSVKPSPFSNVQLAPEYDPDTGKQTSGISPVPKDVPKSEGEMIKEWAESGNEDLLKTAANHSNPKIAKYAQDLLAAIKGKSEQKDTETAGGIPSIPDDIPEYNKEFAGTMQKWAQESGNEALLESAAKSSAPQTAKYAQALLSWMKTKDKSEQKDDAKPKTIEDLPPIPKELQDTGNSNIGSSLQKWAFDNPDKLKDIVANPNLTYTQIGEYAQALLDAVSNKKQTGDNLPPIPDDTPPSLKNATEAMLSAAKAGNVDALKNYENTSTPHIKKYAQALLAALNKGTASEPKPIKIDPSKFPAMPNFIDPKFAEANKGTAEVLQKLAAAGNLDALTAHDFPSPKLQAYKNDLVANLQSQLNPPKELKKISVSLESIKKVYKGVAGVPKSQMIGRYIVVDDLGGVPELSYPPITLEYESYATTGFPLKDKKMQKQHLDAFKKIKGESETAADLIQQYTGPESGDMNAVLWQNKDNPDVKLAGELLTHYSVPLTPGTMLSRKISLSDGIISQLKSSIGKVLQEPQFSSCSIDPKKWHGNVQLIIKTSPGTKGLYVGSKISENKSEAEMILPPGTRMVITKYEHDLSADTNNGRHKIHVIALATTPEQCC